MNPHDPLEDLLPRLKTPASRGFARRVRLALPVHRHPVWWPGGWAWAPPMVAGALAMLALSLFRPYPQSVPVDSESAPRIVRFELLAAEATEVQLVGSFTQWETGRIQLYGPDATGHWTVELALPEGRHEYGFLVDGYLWVSDPQAELKRQDGFGQLNAVLEI